MNNEKEMQAMVKRLSKASAKKALEKERVEVISDAVGRAQQESLANPKITATLENYEASVKRLETAQKEFHEEFSAKCTSKRDLECSITTYACKDYMCPKLKLPKQ